MKDQYGRINAKAIKKLEKIAKLVEDKERLYTDMSDAELTKQTDVLKERLAHGESLDDLLPDAYAVCREASKRVLNQRHYHVQVLGGIALHQGRICQMATGEGKTLTETLPAYLNALSGNGVHIVTVNEYLATRDMEWMGKVFKFLGLSVGVTLNKQTAREKRAAYECDITYGTNNEFGFDYLRDNMSTSRAQCVQRGLNFVIIDEVDSILIDEARTPLIISGPSGKSSDTYKRANNFVCTLQNSTNVDDEGKPLDENEEPNGHYVVDQKDKTVRLTDRGIEKAERYFTLENLSDPENTDLNHYINNALRAHAIMHRDDDYIVEKRQIIIVDSFTGRKMEGRRYSNGLHQAIEAKENVPIQEENKTLATITFQNYFRLYHKMSGMTGTAKTEEREFNTIYNIDVVAIPTNLPMARDDREDMIFSSRQGKLRAIVREVAARHEKGQPLLIGTVTVEKSEELSKMLSAQKIPHNVLNAKNHKHEAEIIAQAGRYGAVTIATNMAGRGTDILLGGNPEFMAKQDMSKQGYDDEQIEASTSFVKGDPDVEILQKTFSDLVKKYKVQTEQEKRKVLDAGGLCVIGTERHDSRRIDDQLRGRAGRQGDPGASVFYVSAEDDMVRIFSGDVMKRAMTFLRVDDDTPMQAKLLSRAIESAQKRIEGIHFSARKNVLQYDDVNNQQRKVIYRERNRVLDGEDVHAEISDMSHDYARYALEDACSAEENTEKWDFDEINKRLQNYLSAEEPLLTPDNSFTAREACNVLEEKCRKLLEERAKQLDEEDLSSREIERYVLLRTTDKLWMDHIDALDDLRKGVGLQAIGQHDPLLVYKKEAYDMFEKLNEQIKVQTIRMLLYGKFVRNLSAAQRQPEGELNPNKNRNGPCPCGSGKKYKDCCLKKDLEKQKSVSSVPANQTGERELTNKERYALIREQRKLDKQKK
ncbi:MAG: preprotein translocase subunit SecA [Corallococcus sp.]|nr:preprotein translocase subunit SecA [Corallococcus sp.]MCM1359034.1 preprotein translocase subunit SecA [Corallococcus sp.]MCM1395023.1 preprotein translocase subunit SecA [Corallococcus sp.]